MIFWNKKINSDEYLDLKQELAILRLEFKELRLEFDLVIKKLKIKYKINHRDKDKEEEENINSPVLLPEE